MKKVYKLTLIPILSLLVLITTFFVGCSSKPTAENNTPTYPQTFETDTNRNIFQEVADYIKKNGTKSPNGNGSIFELGLTPSYVYDDTQDRIADYNEIWYDQQEDIIEIRSDFYTMPNSKPYHMWVSLLIPRQTSYNSTNFTIMGDRRYDYNFEYFATLPNTPKDFREQVNDPFPIRTINFDSTDFRSEASLRETALNLGKCLSAVLPVFDNFFREKLKYFPDKLEDGTVLPTEVSQYAILSYFHLPVAVKVNPIINPK